MGRKHVVSYPLFANADASVAQTSKTITTTEMDKASIHVTLPAGSTGTLQILVRNGDSDPFYELSFGTALTVSSTDTDIQLVLNEMPFKEMQLVWSPTSATGALNATLLQKSVGS